jgi:transcriptional regulator with XRE-family HTH domain
MTYMSVVSSAEMRYFCDIRKGHMRHDRLRQIRDARRATLDEIAERSGISTRQLIRYEAGTSDPTATVLEKLARVLGVSADYLLGITDEVGDVYAESGLTPSERALIMSLREKRSGDAAEAFATLMKGNH